MVGSKAGGSAILLALGSTLVLFTILMLPSSLMSTSVCLTLVYAQIFGFRDDEVADELFLYF